MQGLYISTFLPYTTLYRSEELLDRLKAKLLEKNMLFNERKDIILETALLGNDAGIIGRDRKSTRLNSSHVAISYAVFCLTKKNTTIDVWIRRRRQSKFVMH